MLTNDAPPTFVPVLTPQGQEADTNITTVCGPYNQPNITAACLQYLYGIPATPATSPGNGILVTGYVQQYANAEDLKVRACKGAAFPGSLSECYV